MHDHGDGTYTVELPPEAALLIDVTLDGEPVGCPDGWSEGWLDGCAVGVPLG